MSRQHFRFGSRFVYALGVAGALSVAVGLGGCADVPLTGGETRSSAETVLHSTSDELGVASDMAGSDADSAAVSAALIVTGDATIISSDPWQSGADFRQYVRDIGGSIDSTRESNTDFDVSSQIGARIPADKYDEAVAHLPEFGSVRQQWTNVVDVQQQQVDLTARVSALEQSVARLNQLASEATTIDDMLKAEDLLTQRQADLDSLREQLTWLEDQVSMSTLNVTFTTASTEPGSGFSIDRAWNVLIGSLSFVTYVLIAMLPWLVIVAIVVAVIRVVLKRRSRRKLAAETGNANPPRPSNSTPEEHSQQLGTNPDTSFGEGATRSENS